jgi:hypothetical protein
MLGNNYVVNRAQHHSFFASIEKGIDWGFFARPRGNTFRTGCLVANIAPRKGLVPALLDARQDSICDLIKAMFFLDLIASISTNQTYTYPGEVVIILQ